MHLTFVHQKHVGNNTIIYNICGEVFLKVKDKSLVSHSGADMINMKVERADRYLSMTLRLETQSSAPS